MKVTFRAINTYLKPQNILDSVNLGVKMQIIFKRRFKPTKETYQSKQNVLRALNCKNPLRATLLAFFPVVEITAKRLFITLQGVALL